jgi:hypothetical protein
VSKGIPFSPAAHSRQKFLNRVGDNSVYRTAGALAGTDFCFIFAPYGYDEPEILLS